MSAFMDRRDEVVGIIWINVSQKLKMYNDQNMASDLAALIH